MALDSSQSPRARRASTQNHAEHAKGSVPSSFSKAPRRVSEGDEGAEKVESNLNIESVNSRAAPTRRK
jgi:hypothetical protein